MVHAPYGLRLLVGAAVTVLEETRKLPQMLLMSPMTLASQAAHLVMRVQQNVADLVIKGDETLDALFPPKDEQPEWATFDEDLEGEEPPPVVSTEADRERLTEGRFALYSTPLDPPDTPDEKAGGPAAKEAGLATVDAPDIAIELDYDVLTLAQLRARLSALSVADLDALLAYEGATKARAPFQTLLANRITRATAK
jgi:hypothetical protein